MDARLVPLATSMWLSSALVIYSSGRLDSQAILFLLAIALIGLFYMPHVRVRTAIAAVLIGVLAGSAVALIRTIPLQDSAVKNAIRHERVVHVIGFVSADPIEFERKQALDWSSQSASVVEISMRSISVGDTMTSLRLPISVFSTSQTAKQIVSLIPGTQVHIVGKIKPANPGRKYAATINAIAIRVITNAPKYQIVTAGLRHGLHETLQHSSSSAQGLIPGLALGDSTALTDDLKKDMRAAGLTHLIAVSGANVALLLAFVNRLLYRHSLRFQFIASVVALSGYVVLVRPQPSVVRAATMATIVLMAHSARWRLRALPALCAAVIVLLFIDPWLSTSYGFALSTLATAGLVTIASRMQNSFERSLPRRIPVWIVELLALTTAAQLAVLPIVIGLGSRISLGSIPANVLAVPLATPAMFSGLAASLTAVMSIPLAQFVVSPGVWAAEAIAFIAHQTARNTAMTITFPAGILGVITALIVVGIALDFWKRWHQSDIDDRQFIATFIAIATFLVWWRPDLSLKVWPPADWVFVMCDVGQGDGLVLRTSKNSAIVLDAGSEPDPIDRCLRELHITYVPIFIMTHFHADHVGGIQGVFKHRTVGRVWTTALHEPELTTSFALMCLSQHDIEPEIIGQLHHEVVGIVDLQVIWPARIIHGQGSDPNNASIAIVATINSHRIFLAGDLEPAAQSAILESWPVSQVDVLKVAHHGSANQFSPLIERLHPRDAVISVGEDNDYGHPALETLALLNSIGARVWRTDEQGALAVISRNNSWTVQAQN